MSDKLLTFINCPHYKIDEDGNLFRFRFWKCGLNEEKVKEIISLRKMTTIKYLCEKYNVSNNVISRIFKFSPQEYWIKMKFGLNKSSRALRYQVVLYNTNKEKKNYIYSRLVCEAFHGPCPQGMECCHNDGNGLNFHPSNLRWDTHKNNEKDKIRHGTSGKGERHSQAKLKNKDIPLIKELGKFCTMKEIANIFDSNPGDICNIINGKR